MWDTTYFETTQCRTVSGLDDGKRKTKRGWSPGDSLNLVCVLSVRVNYSQQCRNDINGRWEYSKSIIRHFTDDIFKCIFLNENMWILINISLKFVPSGQIDNIPLLVQMKAWCRRSSLLTHICVTWPQWVKLNLLGLKPEHSGITRSIQLLLIPWLHQSIARTLRQPNYPNQLAPKRGSQSSLMFDPNQMWWANGGNLSIVQAGDTLSSGGLSAHCSRQPLIAPLITCS